MDPVCDGCILPWLDGSMVGWFDGLLGVWLDGWWVGPMGQQNVP
jgi:hypothetical protein